MSQAFRVPELVVFSVGAEKIGTTHACTVCTDSRCTHGYDTYAPRWPAQYNLPEFRLRRAGPHPLAGRGLCKWYAAAFRGRCARDAEAPGACGCRCPAGPPCPPGTCRGRAAAAGSDPALSRAASNARSSRQSSGRHDCATARVKPPRSTSRPSPSGRGVGTPCSDSVPCQAKGCPGQCSACGANETSHARGPRGATYGTPPPAPARGMASRQARSTCAATRTRQQAAARCARLPARRHAGCWSSLAPPRPTAS